MLICDTRFYHVSNSIIKKLASANRVGLTDAKMDKYTCEACCVRKATKIAYTTLKSRQTREIYELIHTDLCDPMLVKSIGDSRFITFTNDFSRNIICMGL